MVQAQSNRMETKEGRVLSQRESVRLHWPAGTGAYHVEQERFWHRQLWACHFLAHFQWRPSSGRIARCKRRVCRKHGALQRHSGPRPVRRGRCSRKPKILGETRLGKAQEAVDAASETHWLARNRYEGGLATYLEVLSAEETLLASLSNKPTYGRSHDLRHRPQPCLGGRLPGVQRTPPN